MQFLEFKNIFGFSLDLGELLDVKNYVKIVSKFFHFLAYKLGSLAVTDSFCFELSIFTAIEIANNVENCLNIAKLNFYVLK